MPQRLSDAEILELGDLNLAESAREMLRWHTGYFMQEADDLLLAASHDPFPVGYSNTAMPLGTAPPADPAALLESAEHFFDARGRGFTLWVRAHLDASLSKHAESRGLSALVDMPGMVLDAPVKDAALTEEREIACCTNIRTGTANGAGHRMKKKLQKLKYRLGDMLNLKIAKHIDIQAVDSVCLTLGPYRNLTTLTAAALFLHPNCQILNHAGRRIFANREINFLLDFNKERLDRFIQFAIRISSEGQRGSMGGSITHSHAFDSKHEMKNVYAETGLDLRKNQIKCLFWKESHRTSNLIRDQHVELASIFETEDRLRFLLPIRNPLDCAKSNLKTGHFKHFKELGKTPSILEVVQAVLDEIFWFADLKERFPDRFFYYFEHEISHDMLVRLAEFLQLEPNESWITNALSVMDSKSQYEHDGDLLSYYRDYVCDKGSRFQDLSKGLLSFID